MCIYLQCNTDGEVFDCCQRINSLFNYYTSCHLIPSSFWDTHWCFNVGKTFFRANSSCQKHLGDRLHIRSGNLDYLITMCAASWMMAESAVWHVFNRGGLFCLPPNSCPFLNSQSSGSCHFVSHSYRGQGWVATSPAVNPHLLTDGQMGSGGQRRILPAALAARLEVLASLQSLSDSLLGSVIPAVMIRLQSFSKHFCQSRNAPSKWGVIKQLAGNMVLRSERPWQMMSRGQSIICDFLLYDRANKSLFAADVLWCLNFKALQGLK